MRNQSIQLLVFVLTIGTFAPRLCGQLNIPSDGSDGDLVVTSSTNIDLGQAALGAWDADNSSHKGNGIYDSGKWAVVFKYASASIAPNVTLSFKNHPTHAPVVWLVRSDVVINGTLNLNGSPGTTDPFNLAEPGPGGFRGGAPSIPSYGLNYGGGFGPGGLRDDGGYYAGTYGNPQLLPLVGGSGGSGQDCGPRYGGAAGGGAILIAASGTITVNGACAANSIAGSCGWVGSGGGIRFIADQILGSGQVYATGAHPGRIRLEANFASSGLTVIPSTAIAVPNPVKIWPDNTAPTAAVISVGGQPAPPDPTASLSGPSADVAIPSGNVVPIIVQTSNFPTNGTVTVYLKPRNSSQTVMTAGFVSGNVSSALWQVTTNVPAGYNIIQARAVAN